MPRTITRLHTPPDDQLERLFSGTATAVAAQAAATPNVLELLLDGDAELPAGWVDNGDGTATFPGVELCAVGTWLAAAGDGNVDEDDLDAAVEADNDPEVDAAPIRLGHVDPRFDGEPALGWATNLRRDGATLIGDLVSVPRKLAGVVHTMYRRRSAGLAPPTTTPSGKTYKTRLAHLALLGVTEPAVKGLADLGTLLASAAGGDGARILLAESLSLNAQQERVSGAWREQRRQAVGDDVYSWVAEVYPDRIIVEEDGRYYRVGYVVDGDGAVTFGTAKRVRRVWQDEDDPAETMPATAIFSAASGQGSTQPAREVATLAANGSRGPGSSSVTDTTTSNGGPHMATIDEARLRELRGIEDDADFDRRVAELLAAANEGNGDGTGGDGSSSSGTPAETTPGVHPSTTTPAPATQPTQPTDAAGQPAAGELVGAGANLAAGTTVLPTAEAERLLAAAEQLRVDARDRLLSAAAGDGRITVAELGDWQTSYDENPALVERLLAARPAGSAMPTTMLGSGDAAQHGDAVTEAQAKADVDTFGGV